LKPQGALYTSPGGLFKAGCCGLSILERYIFRGQHQGAISSDALRDDPEVTVTPTHLILSHDAADGRQPLLFDATRDPYQ
jgi:hypothetical protein